MTLDRLAIIVALAVVGGLLKSASVKEVKDNLFQLLKTAEKEDVIITKSGRPSAVIIRHLGEDETEDYLLERDPKFRAQFEKR